MGGIDLWKGQGVGGGNESPEKELSEGGDHPQSPLHGSVAFYTSKNTHHSNVSGFSSTLE